MFEPLLVDDVVRAGAFFALAFGVTVVGGFILGDPRLGVEIGLPVGIAFGIFAYVFVRPASDEAEESA